MVESFESVAKRELPVLYRVARRMVRDPSDAEDLVSQTLFLAARAWDQFDGRYARSWLIKIMRNEQSRLSRSARAQHPSVSLDEAPDPSTGNREWVEIDAAIIGDRIFVELEKLPEEYRTAVTLCDSEGLSYEEVSAALDIPVGTVKSRLFRGRRLLRDRLSWIQVPTSVQGVTI